MQSSLTHFPALQSPFVRAVDLGKRVSQSVLLRTAWKTREVSLLTICIFGVALLSLAGSAAAYPTQAQALQAFGVGSISELEFSPDGRFIILTHGNATTAYSVQDGSVARQFPMDIGVQSSMCVSADGSNLAVVAQGVDVIEIFDFASGRLLKQLGQDGFPPLGLAFHPSGNSVLKGSNNMMPELIDIATGASISVYNVPGGILDDTSRVRFYSSGNKVLWAASGKVATFNLDGSLILSTSGIGFERCRALDMSSDESIIFVESQSSSSEQREVHILDSATLSDIWPMETGQGLAVSKVRDEYAYFNSASNKIQFRKQSDGGLLFEMSSVDLPSFGRISPDGDRLAFAYDLGSHPVEIYQITRDGLGAIVGLTLERVISNLRYINDAALITSGRSILAPIGLPFQIVENGSGMVLQQYGGTALSVDSNRDLSRVALFDAGGRLEVLNSSTLASIWSATAPPAEMLNVASAHAFVSENGLAAVVALAKSPVGSGSSILIFRSGSSAPIQTSTLANRYIRPNAGDISPNNLHYCIGLYNSSSGTGYLELGDMDGLSPPLEATIPPLRAVGGVAFSPDSTLLAAGGGRYVAGGSDSDCYVYDATAFPSLAQVQHLTNGPYSFGAMQFSDNATLYASTEYEPSGRLWPMNVWNWQTGIKIRTLNMVDEGAGLQIEPQTGNLMMLGYRGSDVSIFEISKPKAIIVAGGGSFSGNSIAQQTDDLGAYAYRVLEARGYDPPDIQYLSAFGPRDADGDGFDDTPGHNSSLSSLQTAITGSFGATAGRLFIMVIDHGYATSSTGSFRLNETQVLSAGDLNTWLNQLQSPPSNVDVTLVVDSCYSGWFVENCKATAGQKRTVISSTSMKAEAVLMPPPDLTSFSQSFLSSAYMGNSIGQAWRAGRDLFNFFPVANQTPQIDDGSGATTIADKKFFGGTWAYGVQSTTDINGFFPAFASVPAGGAVGPGSGYHMTVQTLPSQDPLSITATIRPPAPSVLSGDPIVALQTVNLTMTGPSTWEGDITSAMLSLTGTYNVSLNATFNYERISNPAGFTLTVSSGPDPDQTPIHAILAVGNTTDPNLAVSLRGLAPLAYSIYLDRFKNNLGTPDPTLIDYRTPYLPDPDRDGAPSSAAVLSDINNVPLSAGRLYVHLIGNSTAAGNITMNTSDNLTATALDAALDALQTRQTCEVVLVVDSPYSGSFLNPCKATGVQKRVVMTSGRPTDTALFLPPPTLISFSEQFLYSGFRGNNLLDGFRSGKNFFQTFVTAFSQTRILPQIDDKGLGYNTPPDPSEGLFAQTRYLGHKYAFAGDDASGLPFILDISTTQTVQASAPVTVQITLIEGADPIADPNGVFGQLIDASAVSSSPVSSLPKIPFTRDTPGGWSWSAAFPAPAQNGQYTLAVYAAYPSPTLSDPSAVKLSEPAFTGLIVECGSGPPWPGSLPDIYEGSPYMDDYSTTTLNTIGVSPAADGTQDHTLHSVCDVDWIICPQFAPPAVYYPFTLTFGDLTLPDDSILQVDIYKDGLANMPQTDWIYWTDSGTTRTMSWLGQDFAEVYCSISLVQGGIEPALSYQVTFSVDTGAGNGIATAGGSARIYVGWSPSGFSSGTEFNVRRSSQSNPTSFVTVNATPIPIASLQTSCSALVPPPTHGCPNTLDPAFRFISDTGLQPDTIYNYQLYAVGSASPFWTGSCITDLPTPVPTPPPGNAVQDWSAYD